MKKTLALCVLGFVVVGASAQNRVSPALGGQPQSQPQQQVQLNGLAQAAIRTGAANCAARVNQVSNFLIGNAQAGVNLMFPTVEGDRRMLSASLEIPGGATGLAYGSMTFAPNQANGCGAVYETVVYWPKKCDDVAAKEYQGLKRVGVVQKQIQVLDNGSTMRVFLMPVDAGLMSAGCVGIKKELVM